MLMDAIVTNAAGKRLAEALRQFPSPNKWPSLMNPISYRRSYSLSDMARWSVIAPVLLGCFLRPEHLDEYFYKTLLEKDRDPVKTIVELFAAGARSNCATMGIINAKDCRNLQDISLTDAKSFKTSWCTQPSQLC